MKFPIIHFVYLDSIIFVHRSIVRIRIHRLRIHLSITEVSGVRKSDARFPLDDRCNLFISVHHPRFVKFYAEKIVPDLERCANLFFMRNFSRIQSYLKVNKYNMEMIAPDQQGRTIRITDPENNEVKLPSENDIPTMYYTLRRDNTRIAAFRIPIELWREQIARHERLITQEKRLFGERKTDVVHEI